MAFGVQQMLSLPDGAAPQPNPPRWAEALRHTRLDADPNRHAMLIMPSHPQRRCVEACIRSVYWSQFGARRLGFPRTLLALLADDGRALCGAGLRAMEEGFFSEVYFDEPIQLLVSRCAGTQVTRERIFEVTTLASRSAEAAPIFIRHIVALGLEAGFAWCFFTATLRLRQLLRRLGIPILELQPADPARIADRASWGRYYDCLPIVCAVNGSSLAGLVAPPAGGKHA